MTQITLPHNHGESADELFSLLPAPQEFQTSAELFGLLSDESRLRIFWILCHYEECVINLSSLVGMSSPAVSHHLKILKEAEIVNVRREGTKNYYYLDSKKSQWKSLTELINLIFVGIQHIGENDVRKGE